MNLDTNGLPVQSDGDALDQLNRVGLLALSYVDWRARLYDLMVEAGVYVRHIGANPNNVSGDQLVPVFAAHSIEGHLIGKRIDFQYLTLAMLKRLGFAQNTHDTDGRRKLAPPDFLLHRVLPFIARVYGWHTIVCLADTILFFNTLITVIDLRMRNNPDHVDPFVNGCATLYACNVYRPTFLSKLSARMLEAGSVPVYGAIAHSGPQSESNVCGGLAWYHRSTSGGNPEVGEVQMAQWVETLKIARS